MPRFLKRLKIVAFKIYIAGPMTGYPEFNFPAFFKAEDYIREHCWLKNMFVPEEEKNGFIIYNPARHDIEAYGIDVTGTKGDPEELPVFNLRKALAWDMARICECDMIYMLKDWEHSAGARAEHTLANALKLQVVYET